jgi:hypothetical protein
MLLAFLGQAPFGAYAGAPDPAAADRGAPRAYVEITTPDFVLLTPAGDSRARQLAAELLTFRRALESLLGAPLRSSLPTTIFALEGEAWTRYAQPRAGMAGYFTAQPFAADLMFDASMPGQQPLELMLHEYTHHLLRTLGPIRLPPFVDEGLAQVLGTARFAPRVIRFGLRADHLAELRGSAWLPFEQLVDVRRSDAHYLDYSLARGFYAQSWATMFYVLSPETGRRRRLPDYLERLRNAPDDAAQGPVPDDDDGGRAVEALIGQRRDRANDAISRFLLGPEAPPALAIRVPREHDAGEIVARRIGADEYEVRLGELLLRLGNRGTLARGLLRGVAPDSAFAPRARLGAALAVLQSGDLEFATSLLDDPGLAAGIDTAGGVRLARGLLQLSLTGAPPEPSAKHGAGPEVGAGGSRRQRLARARALFEAAIDAPCCGLEATQGYVLATLALQGPEPQLLARALRAYGAAPSNPELASAVALVHEAAGRSAQARPYWLAAARSLRDGPARSRILERLRREMPPADAVPVPRTSP